MGENVAVLLLGGEQNARAEARQRCRLGTNPSSMRRHKLAHAALYI